jgi:hypothetical protein
MSAAVQPFPEITTSITTARLAIVKDGQARRKTMTDDDLEECVENMLCTPCGQELDADNPTIDDGEPCDCECHQLA